MHDPVDRPSCDSATVRLDVDLVASASAAGEVAGRTAEDQLARWARLGRELERAPIDQRRVEAALKGGIAYDDLDEIEQIVVRTTWDQGIARSVANLDLVTEFAAEGRTWTDGTADGRAIRRSAADLWGGSRRPASSHRRCG